MPCPGQLLEFTRKRSCQPSPSASIQTAPLPRVSGRYFSPNAPVVCVKSMPAAPVASLKVTDCAAVNGESASQTAAAATPALPAPVSRSFNAE